MSLFIQAANLLKYCMGGVHPMTGPPKVSWLVTSRCNSRCMHCTMWKRHDEEALDEPTKERVLHELRQMSVRHIAFSGGEMFLYERMLQLISKAKSMGFVTSGNSNGLMLGRELVEKIGGAGLDIITLSLDGSSPEVHDRIRGVRGGHEQILRAIALLLRRTTVRVFTNITVSPLNVHDVVRTFELASKLGVAGVSVQPINAVEIFSPDEEAVGFSDQQLVLLERQLNEIKTRYSRLLMHPGEYLDRFVTFLKNPRRILWYRCSAGYYFLMIMPDGSVYACPVLFGKLGNVREDTLSRIWFSKRAVEIRNLVRAGKHPACWVSCISPINVLLSNFSTLRLSRVMSRGVLRHILDNLIHRCSTVGEQDGHEGHLD